MGRSGARAAEGKEDEYMVTLEKPVGLNFYRGNDGGTYIDKIQPGGSADATGLFTVGDKVLETRWAARLGRLQIWQPGRASFADASCHCGRVA